MALCIKTTVSKSLLWQLRTREILRRHFGNEQHSTRSSWQSIFPGRQ
jgi:hypothetical protein